MQILRLKSHLCEEELKQITFSQKSVRDFQDWQIIYLVQLNKNKKASEIAEILGVNVYRIYNIIELYNKYGQNWKMIKNRGGRRNETCYLSLEDEKLLLADLNEMALQGQIHSAMDIKNKIEIRIGHSVSDDYIWDLFKRHGWCKKSLITQRSNKENKPTSILNKAERKVWMPS
jgi:transposase